ncbi:MAG TPA: hypothetical protein VEG44_00845 [Candidatus Acidoferrales bacterium]|nr:hypothetical protein [Candidatus Acidoferrales bacterium]
MLIIPLVGPWIALPVLVTGAAMLVLGDILNTPPTQLGACIVNCANCIILLGLA